MKQTGHSEHPVSGIRTPEWQKIAARRDALRNASDLKQEGLTPSPLEQQPLDTLRALARKKYISGRSSMSKVELIQALRRS
jgi:hypothetical protein